MAAIRLHPGLQMLLKRRFGDTNARSRQRLQGRRTVCSASGAPSRSFGRHAPRSRLQSATGKPGRLAAVKTCVEILMAIRDKWQLESHGVRLPGGHLAPATSATYLAEPRPDKHSLRWLEPTFATEVEATEWRLNAVLAWLDARLDSGESASSRLSRRDPPRQQLEQPLAQYQYWDM